MFLMFVPYSKNLNKKGEIKARIEQICAQTNPEGWAQPVEIIRNIQKVYNSNPLRALEVFLAINIRTPWIS